MSFQVSYKKQFLLMLMLLLVLFLIIEGIAIIYDYFYPRCYLMTNEVTKNMDYNSRKQLCVVWENMNWYEDPITGIKSADPNQHHPYLNINSHGFRGPETLKEKPENTFRIFVVGASTTFSIRVLSDQETMPGHLQENFDSLQKNKEIQVINAGIVDIASTHELQLIKTKIVQFEPDLIIIYDGIRDLTNEYTSVKEKMHKDFFRNIYDRYFKFYQTLDVIKGILKQKPPIRYVEPHWEDKAELWKNNLIAICELGKQHGYETLIILQPMLGSGNKTLLGQEIKNMEFFDQDNALIGFQKFADKLNELDNYCAKTADFRNIFDDINEVIYFDRAHVGSKSNKIIADEMFELAFPLVN